jgi:subfamily B ATP-binding cassette protein MsbA
MKTAVLEEASHPMIELLYAAGIAVAIYFGSGEVLRGQMTSGELLAFFIAFARMMHPVQQLNGVNMKLYQAAAACERIADLFTWRSSLRIAAKPVRLGPLAREIRFESVSFGYPGSDRLVLRDLSFAIPRGAVVAIVGESGAGKTSIASLLTRLYDVGGGAITYDGVDLREADLRSLRERFALVSQDVFLFNDTIEENIACGRPGAGRDEVERAAERAFAAEFIGALPDGYATTVGDRGQKLSGGERQRIAIARAIVRNAPVLILDEATSNLDTRSEAIVQKALGQLLENRTALVIAHRLSTVRSADRILVLKDGQVVEQGRHEDLIRSGGEYRRFHAESG